MFVDNLNRSIEFFRDILGFEVLGEIGDPYVPIKKGNVVIGLAEMRKLSNDHPLKVSNKQLRKGIGVEIVLEANDIKEYYHRVAAKGYPIETVLEKRPWGLEDFRILDPDGYYFRITSTNDKPKN